MIQPLVPRPALVVIADTSPLRYLILIEEVHLLADLYGRVFIPESVVSELDRVQTPGAVRAWIAALPSWAQVCDSRSEEKLESTLAVLGAGERQAILLALDIHADLVLMDERAGVNESRRRGVTAIGTLGVLARGAELGLLDLGKAIDKLKQTNFRAHPRLLDALLKTEQR